MTVFFSFKIKNSFFLLLDVENQPFIIKINHTHRIFVLHNLIDVHIQKKVCYIAHFKIIMQKILNITGNKIIVPIN